MKKIYILLGVIALLAVAFVVTANPVEACTEGCTPGFWKQDQHFQYWPHTLCYQQKWYFGQTCSDSISLGDEPWNFPVQGIPGLIPSCMLSDGILDLNGDGVDDTLLDALNYQGGEDLPGKAQILLRAATAGMLNGMTMDHFAPWMIIYTVNGSLDKEPSTPGCQQRAAGMDYWSTQFDIQNQRGCIFSP